MRLGSPPRTTMLVSTLLRSTARPRMMLSHSPSGNSGCLAAVTMDVLTARRSPAKSRSNSCVSLSAGASGTGDVSSSISHGSFEVSRRLVGTSSLPLESSLLFLFCSLLCLRFLRSLTLSAPCSSSLTSLSSEKSSAPFPSSSPSNPSDLESESRVVRPRSSESRILKYALIVFALRSPAHSIDCPTSRAISTMADPLSIDAFLNPRSSSVHFRANSGSRMRVRAGVPEVDGCG